MLDVRNMVAGPYSQHGWSCSTTYQMMWSIGWNNGIESSQNQVSTKNTPRRIIVTKNILDVIWCSLSLMHPHLHAHNIKKSKSKSFVLILFQNNSSKQGMGEYSFYFIFGEFLHCGDKKSWKKLLQFCNFFPKKSKPQKWKKTLVKLW